MVGGSHLHRIVKHVRPTWPGYIWLSHLKNPQEKTVVLPSLSSSWTTSPLTPDRKEGRFKKQAGRHYSHNCYNLISCDGFWFIEKIGNLLLKTNVILIFPTRIQHLNPLQLWETLQFFVGQVGIPMGVWVAACSSSDVPIKAQKSIVQWRGHSKHLLMARLCNWTK